MKEPEYREGPEALENFKQGMKALFKVPKAEIVKREEKARRKAAIVRQQKRSDKD